MKTVIIDIPADGSTAKLDVQGAPGKECLKLTEQIEIALGDRGHRTHKPELHQQAAVRGQGVAARG